MIILATLPGLDVVVSSFELLIIPSLYSRNFLSSAGISIIVYEMVRFPSTHYATTIKVEVTL